MADDELADDHDEYDREGRPDNDIHDEEPERVAEPPRDQDDQPEPVDTEPALPLLRPAPPPPLPAGTSLLEVDEEDPELHELDGPGRLGYRRAAGE